MRINVYSEEMTDDIELITKEGVIGADGEPTTFHGLRLFLESSDKMHRTPHDDDRSAVTFWIHGTADDAGALIDRLERAALLVQEAMFGEENPRL